MNILMVILDLNDIFKCNRCKRILIAEEFEKHKCTPKLESVISIDFDYYYITKDKMDREEIVIKGMDGNLYSFVKRENKPSDKVAFYLSPSNDMLHRDDSDDNVTEPKLNIPKYSVETEQIYS
jgi:hypothetical protein